MYQGCGQTETTTYCDDEAAQWFAKDVPFAQLQLRDEDNNPAQARRSAARSSPSAKDRGAASSMAG